MNKRKDVDRAWASMTPIDPETDEMLRMAWEFGRIAGIKEAALVAGKVRRFNFPGPTACDEVRARLQSQARNLERRIR